jgi:two-component system, sensor histidine kinase and response regulator
MVLLLDIRNCNAIIFNRDSLLTVTKQDNNPSKKVEALLLISDHYSSFYPDSALLYANQALQIASQYKVTGGLVHTYYAFETIYLNNKNIAKAREYLTKGLTYSDKQNYIDGKVEGYMHYSMFYQMLGKNDSMMFCSLYALELSKKSKNLEIQAGVAHDIGNIYSYQGDYDKALYYCNLALDKWTGIGHKNIAGILSDIGNIYFNKKDFSNALKFYKRAYENAGKNNDALAYGYSLNNIGLVYFSIDSIDTAIKYYKLAIEYYKIDLIKMGIANSESNLGQAYLRQKKYDISITHSLISLDLSKQLDYKKGILDAFRLLADAEAGLNNYEMAWHYQKQASNYQDSLNNLNLSKKITDYETKFEIERKDNEYKLLLANQQQQKAELKRQFEFTVFICIVLLLFLIIAILSLIISAKRKRELRLMSNFNARILEQKRNLEEANEVKTQLFSIVSHDFKSPLASLNLFLSVLELGNISIEEIKELARELMNRMNITFSFIDNLLGWAQSQLKGYNPIPVKANPHDIVESSFDLYKKQAQTKGIQFLNNIDPAIRIITDDNMLKLVMRNLISNALKYSMPGGILEIYASKNDKALIISVKDNGIGITDEIKRKLFSSLKVNTIGTAEEPGTGLGLMLCKEFIEKNGGKIWVESEPGKGSTFSFSIPIA